MIDKSKVRKSEIIKILIIAVIIIWIICFLILRIWKNYKKFALNAIIEGLLFYHMKRKNEVLKICFEI